MTAQQFKGYLTDVRAVAVLVAGIAAGLGTAGASWWTSSVDAQQTARLTAIEARVASLEEFKKFQGCWMLEQSEGRDPNPCRYLLSDPDEFRPPFNGPR